MKIHSLITMSALAMVLAAPVMAQQKQSLSYSKSSSDSRYTQEHMIDVGDVPGHQVRIYEITLSFKNDELAFEGVAVKEQWVRGMSDYTNWSGPATTYSVYVLEDGNKVFMRGTVTSQMTANADGSKALRFSTVENFVGGTGKFVGIRGQTHSSGSRVPGEKALTVQTAGEYWIEQ